MPPRAMNGLAGRAALLTGASGGIGAPLAEGLAGAGARVALSGRRADVLEALAQRIRDRGGRAEVVVADLTDPDDAAGLIARAEQAVGPIDVLVNNAGIELASDYASLTPEEIERSVAVNLTAPMLLTHAVLPGMRERGRGHVVNIASVAGKAPIAFDVPYSTTKAGLISLTRGLHAEHAGSPIGFSVVCPGFVEGDGMYGRMVAEGFRAPLVPGTTSASKVVDAVLRSIAEDRVQTIVNGVPLRPLIALNELLPGMGEWIVAATGTRRMFRGLARHNNQAHSAHDS